MYGGRHSYSLTTFDPTGNLDQVVRAIRASTLGVPIVAVAMPPDDEDDGESTAMDGSSSMSDAEMTSSTTHTSEASPSSAQTAIHSSGRPISSSGGIYACVPLRFLSTSPLLIDDGSPRVVPITSSICILPTGVGADGRALCDIAIKLALGYRYLYGEEMPVAELLEGLAEKMQEMTMKGGARPFGCALLVGYLGDDGGIPSMYRVDPSGVVQLLTSYNNMQVFDSVDDSEDNTTTRKRSGRRGSFAFLGNWSTLGQKKNTIQSQLQNQAFKNEEEVQRMLVTAARQTFEEDMSDTVLSTEKRKNQPVLFIAFTRERSLQVSRVDSD